MSKMNVDRYVTKVRAICKFGNELKLLSACKRLQVGCVVFDPECNSVLGIGYNGPPRGRPNDSCSGSENQCGCVHAEANALIKSLSKNSPCLMYSTSAPCERCAGLIVNSGIVTSMIYDRDYRLDGGLKLLAESGIDLMRVDTLRYYEENVLKSSERNRIGSILRRWRLASFSLAPNNTARLAQAEVARSV